MLIGIEGACWLIAIAAALAAIPLLSFLLGILSAMPRPRCRTRAILFAAMSVVATYWAGGKGRSGQPQPPLRDGGDPDPQPETATNIRFTAFTKTPSNFAFSCGWPEEALPRGSRLELHEKLFSLTNGWSPVGLYVVAPSQTNLQDVVSLTNGHPKAAYYGLYGDALSISFPDLATVEEPGRRLSLAIFTNSMQSCSYRVAVERSERPPEFPPGDPAFAADPFSPVDGLSYDSAAGTVSAAAPGAFALATGDKLVVIDPVLTFGTPHRYAGSGLEVRQPGLRSGESYDVISRYPLDEPCLWEGWHVGTNTEHGCTCEPELDLGVDVSAYTNISCSVSVTGDTAYAWIFLGGTPVWSNTCEHARLETGSGGRDDILSGDGCSSCGSCASGDCDAFDGPSVGSVRFRLSLGSPADGLVSGFLWFESDAAFDPSPGSFSLLRRADANVADSTEDGTRTVVCSDRGGRTLAISPFGDGVRIDVTFTATGGNDRAWEISREGDAMRFRKFSAGGNLMTDVTYSPEGGGWTATDNVSGLSETTFSSGGSLSAGSGWARTVETVASCGPVTASHVRVTSEIVGWGGGAVLRETERLAKRANGSWAASRASYWDDAPSRRHGMVRMVWGDDRAWSWARYDAIGRETFRLDQRDGSPAPEDSPSYTLSYLPSSTDAFATFSNYAPHPGDSCHTNDFERPRTVSRYIVADGQATLVGRTWTRITRGLAANGWPTVAEMTIRSSSQAAEIGDPGNAVSTVVRYDEESPTVPYLLRGEVLCETNEDGVVEAHCHVVLSNSVLRTVVVRTKGAHEAKTREVVERDIAYGMTLYEATQLAADPAVEFGWRRHAYDSRGRLRLTQYDDGSSETNEYSCCRLLSRTGRDGAKTLHCATTGTERLYRAEEEVCLAQLPRGDDYRYAGGMWTEFRSAFRVTQRWFDAFGRETNTVVRSDTVQGASSSPNSTATRWYTTRASTEYPSGMPDLSVRVDERGLETTHHESESQHGSVHVESERLPGAAAPDCVTTNVSVRGGGSVSVRASCGHVTATRTFSEYAADGTRRELSVTESDDCGVVTNKVVSYDFLGRAVEAATPVSRICSVYDGAGARVLVSADQVSGVATTNLYDAAGELVGAVSRGVRTERVTSYAAVSGEWWRVDREVVSSGTRTNSAVEARSQLTGLSDALRSRSVTLVDGAETECVETSFDPETLDTVETVHSATGGETVRRVRFGRVLEETSPAGHVWNYYDFFGWLFYVKRSPSPEVSARKHRLIEHSDFGDVVGDGLFARSTFASVQWRRHDYDARGNRVAETNEVGYVALRSYDAVGRVVSEGGDASYPVQSGYDSAGRRTSLSTTRDGTTWDDTQWAYDPATGACTSKTYADGSTTSCTYTPDGRPLRTTYASGRWRENAYNARRELASVEYSDGEACTFAYDEFSHETMASNGISTVLSSRSDYGHVTNETTTIGGEMLTVERSFDAFGRLAEDYGSAFAYAEDGRLATISNDIAVVEYQYAADRLGVGYTLTLTNGLTFARGFVRNAYRRNLVMDITNSVDGIGIEAFSYAYDALGRPTARNADTFGYDERGEVAEATIDGNSETHEYDSIGNSVIASVNGVTNIYSANSLNQYTSILRGSASPCEPTYDIDGNMTSDGVMSFTYDAANRLKTFSTNGVQILANFYDAKSRRVKKVTSEATTTFFYDDWNLIEERIACTNGTSSTIHYFWGKDLSGTLQGVGGVGGLLYLAVDGTIYIPCYDNIGNVTRYLDASGNTVAQYTYDAFGNCISKSGPLADFFRHRFSTKYFDVETGLYYYGYRFYHPILMRWLNRDPIEEFDGGNLYSFIQNRASYCLDKLGLYRWVAIYYSRTDQPEFRRAAETYKREIESNKTFNPKCDSVIIKGALTAADFRKVWGEVNIETRREGNQYKIKALHIFTHSGPGMLFLHGASLNASSMETLARLNWAEGGTVVSHGCNTGIHDEDGNSVAKSLAAGQGVQSLGQTGFAQFSENPNRRTWCTRVDSDSQNVYLWSYGDGGPRWTFGEARAPQIEHPPKEGR